jgi:hypothetical protein
MFNPPVPCAFLATLSNLTGHLPSLFVRDVDDRFGGMYRECLQDNYLKED